VGTPCAHDLGLAPRPGSIGGRGRLRALPTSVIQTSTGPCPINFGTRYPTEGSRSVGEESQPVRETRILDSIGRDQGQFAGENGVSVWSCACAWMCKLHESASCLLVSGERGQKAGKISRNPIFSCKQCFSVWNAEFSRARERAHVHTAPNACSNPH
jgi:hypothetical protein